MTSFLAMGGYGAYVWPALGLVAMALVALLVASLRAVRTSEDELKRLEGDSPRRRRTP